MMKFRILLLITVGLLVASANADPQGFYYTGSDAPRGVDLVVNGGFEADVVADGTWAEIVPSGWVAHQAYGTKGAVWNPLGDGTGASDFPYTGVTGNVFMGGPDSGGYTKAIEQAWDAQLQVGETVILEADVGFAITDPPFAADSGWCGLHFYVIRDVTFVDTSRIGGSWSNETHPAYQTHYGMAGEYSWSAGAQLPWKTTYDGSMVHVKYEWTVLADDPITLWGGTALPNKAGLDIAILTLSYGDTALDNVTVTIVPEPATLSLLALGLGFVIRRKR